MYNNVDKQSIFYLQKIYIHLYCNILKVFFSFEIIVYR